MSSDPSDVHKSLYRQAFIRNCFKFILRGYAGLQPNNLKNAEEPDITGELVRSIRETSEAIDAEPWMFDLDILDDPPQNVPGKFGKRRPRIDIEFVRVIRGPRPRFHIEAKRLYRSGSVAEYLGYDGLGMFVAGNYAAKEPSAGMLGYIQSDDSQTWLDRLEKGFSSRARELAVCDPFHAASEYQDIAAVQISGHQRTSSRLGRIDIYHLLLEFR